MSPNEEQARLRENQLKLQQAQQKLRIIEEQQEQLRWQGAMMNSKPFHGNIAATPQMINATPFHGKIAEASQQPESPHTSSPMLHPSSPLYRYSMSPAMSSVVPPTFAVRIGQDEQIHNFTAFALECLL